ncbi:hypothetical protein [Candidatus Endomicrobiellum trichonymphae]|nr:hypothetical protein [Candidatus Endomicrobium trichonymphae]
MTQLRRSHDNHDNSGAIVSKPNLSPDALATKEQLVEIVDLRTDLEK